MTIQSISSTLLRSSGAVDTAPPAKSAPRSSSGSRDTPAAEVDRVQLTPEAQYLRQQAETAGEEPVIDAERIKALRAAIADGSYQANSQRIADKILAFETDLASVLA